jgi:hypothetical protein
MLRQIIEIARKFGLNEIQTINLNKNNGYKISHKMNGTSLPNFHLGWMKLKNDNKALFFITNKENVVLIPTKDFVILFSMEKTEDFIHIINKIR